MSIGHWVKGATRLRLDSHTLGNIVRNGGLAAGSIVGGPPGAAIAGGASAARTAARPGANFGDVLKSGVGDAGTAAGLHAGAGLLGQGAAKIGLGGPAAVVPEAASAAPVPDAFDGFSTGALNTATTHAPPSFLSKVGDGAGQVFDFAEKHPNAASGALSAVGKLASSGSENRLRNAQAATLEKKLGESEYDFERRKANEAQYANLWSPLGAQIGQNFGGGGNVARNPYLPTGA